MTENLKNKWPIKTHEHIRKPNMSTIVLSKKKRKMSLFKNCQDLVSIAYHQKKNVFNTNLHI